MKNKLIRRLSFLPLVLCFYLVSCATITVNVYFPAEEVRDAYSSLEEEFLLEDGDEGTESSDKPGSSTVKPTPAPESSIKYQDEPTLKSKTKVIVLRKEMTLDFGDYAWAQGNISGQITEKIRSMPDVISAYKSRAQRKGIINQMLREGLVREGGQGLLVKSGTLSAEQQKAFSAENADRKIIIMGMAKAIVEINNLEPTPENIDKVLPEAGRQFASVRRSEN